MAGGAKATAVSASKHLQRAQKKVVKSTAKKARKVPSASKPKRQKAHVVRALKERDSKLVENTKQLLVLRGNKTNEDVTKLLRDLRMLKAPYVKMMNKKNDIHPFDDETPLEFIAQKNDTSLFMIGSNTKKRPNNLILGRTFDGHILDMLELEFRNFKSIDAFKCKSKKAPGSKPCFLFAGEQWENNDNFTKLQNLLIDMFRGTIVEQVNVKGLDHVIVCTSAGDHVLFRSYSIDLKKAEGTHPRAELDEMGPRFDLHFRRNKFASADLMRVATKKPKGLAPKKIKNVTRDELTGDKIGRVHVGRQDVYSMQSRRVKALRKTPGAAKEDSTATPTDDA